MSVTIFAVVDDIDRCLDTRVHWWKAVEALRYYRDKGIVCKLVKEITTRYSSSESVVIGYEDPVPQLEAA